MRLRGEFGGFLLKRFGFQLVGYFVDDLGPCEDPREGAELRYPAAPDQPAQHVEVGLSVVLAGEEGFERARGVGEVGEEVRECGRERERLLPCYACVW